MPHLKYTESLLLANHCTSEPPSLQRCLKQIGYDERFTFNKKYSKSNYLFCVRCVVLFVLKIMQFSAFNRHT